MKRMAAPCLVHMLDAYYSSLVMLELQSKKISTFVGIHDCWLVPESQVNILKDAMDSAARKWYVGLEPIYEELLNQLKTGKDGEENEHYKLVSDAYEKWKKQRNNNRHYRKLERMPRHWRVLKCFPIKSNTLKFRAKKVN
jgi:hypothetical protein